MSRGLQTALAVLGMIVVLGAAIAFGAAFGPGPHGPHYHEQQAKVVWSR
jgi:hypothetical protein